MNENRFAVTASLFMLREIKQRKEQVKRGFQLLKRKSEALKINSKNVAYELVDTQKNIVTDFKEAFIILAAAKFTNTEFNGVVLENVGKAQIKVVEAPTNIVGVTTIGLGVNETGEEDTLKFTGLSSGGHRIGEAKRAFRDILYTMIKIASLRNQYVKLDQANKETMRKVNSIQKVIIPKLLNTEVYILMEMDEREREEFHRLKLVKKKKQTTCDMNTSTKLVLPPKSPVARCNCTCSHRINVSRELDSVRSEGTIVSEVSVDSASNSHHTGSFYSIEDDILF